MCVSITPCSSPANTSYLGWAGDRLRDITIVRLHNPPSQLTRGIDQMLF